MHVDFIDLNLKSLRDPYPLANIDKLIERSSKYRMLILMDMHSGYNQIKMNPLDAPKNCFMKNTCNYYYKMIPFDLKNTATTYQRLMISAI